MQQLFRTLKEAFKSRSLSISVAAGETDDYRFDLNKSSWSGTLSQHSVARVVRVCLVLLLFWLVYGWLRSESSSSIFRVSQPVLSSRVHDLVINHGKVMSAYLRHDTESCGISLPNFRIYLRYLIMRGEHGRPFLQMFNPHLTPGQNYPNETRTRTVHETSAMCQNKVARERVRYQQVNVTYTSFEGLLFNVTFEGGFSFCIQHHMDIFEGNWPCVDTGNSTDDGPRVPVLPVHRERDDL